MDKLIQTKSGEKLCRQNSIVIRIFMYSILFIFSDFYCQLRKYNNPNRLSYAQGFRVQRRQQGTSYVNSYKWFQMITNGLKWLHKVKNSFKWLQMLTSPK